MERVPSQSCLEKVAITGATGFIGSHLVRLLVSAGCRPTLLGRSNTCTGLLAGLEERTRRVPCDLADDDSVRSAIQSENPDTLFHLARIPNRTKAADSNILNFYATAQLLEAALENGVRRIVIAGSAEEYGDQPGPLSEGLSLKPRSGYGISKALATKHAIAMYARQGCPVVVVRPFTVYGPGQPGEMFVAQAIKAAVGNMPFKMSPGEQRRDLVFIDDVVRGLRSAAVVPGIEGRVINLGSGRAYRLREVAERIWKMTGTYAPLLIGALKPEPEELYDTWADTTLARNLLNWEASIDLNEGLGKTIDFVRMGLGGKGQRWQTA